MYVLTESARAIRYFDEVIRLTTVVQKESFGEIRENQSVLDALRTALHFYANVSRVFWPARGGKRAAHAEALRVLCGIPDDHPLRSRTLRDHIEHLDERLDDWAGDGRRPYLQFETVEYPRLHPPLTPTEDVVFLIYDVARHEVRIPGAAYPIGELRAAVLDVQSKASEGFGRIIESWGNAPGT